MPTPNRGYPLVAGTDQPNGPVQINAVANNVDTDMGLLFSAGGWTAVTTVATGFTAAAINVRLVGKLVVIEGVLLASYAASHSYTAVATFPAGFRPGAAKTVMAAGSTAASAVKISLNPDGTLDMVTSTVAPNAVDLSCLSGFFQEN